MIYFGLYYKFDNEIERGSDNKRDAEVQTTSEEVARISMNYGKAKVCC